MAAITCQTIVDQVTILSYNVRNFRLRLAQPKRLEFEPGQFVIVHVPTKGLPASTRALSAAQPAGQAGGSLLKRAYSIACPPHEEGVIELCIQHVEGGAASTFFWQLKEGMPVTLSGPHGRFTLKQPITYEPVLMATGTGVAPFRSMLKYLFHVNVTQPIWLLFGTRYEHALLYEAEFRAMASLRHNFHYLPTVSRPKDWHGEIGHIQQTFQKQITDWSNKEIYICGWDVAVKAVYQDLAGFGVPKEKLHFEEW